MNKFLIRKSRGKKSRPEKRAVIFCLSVIENKCCGLGTDQQAAPHRLRRSLRPALPPLVTTTGPNTGLKQDSRTKRVLQSSTHENPPKLWQTNTRMLIGPSRGSGASQGKTLSGRRSHSEPVPAGPSARETCQRQPNQARLSPAQLHVLHRRRTRRAPARSVTSIAGLHPSHTREIQSSFEAALAFCGEDGW